MYRQISLPARFVSAGSSCTNKIAVPPMQQQLYHDPMNRVTNDREDPHSHLQGHHLHQ